VATFHRGLLPAILVLLPLLFIATVVSQLESVHGAEAGAQRGKYIVEGVAKCIECHTPRDGSGKLKESAYLRGAPIPVNAPPYKNMKWALQAPNIAGLPGYTEADGIRLLTEGINRNGDRPNPPMPEFRMTREDARAVVAYLKSLE
jgi:mono/diheme cytochrome c family protein